LLADGGSASTCFDALLREPESSTGMPVLEVLKYAVINVVPTVVTNRVSANQRR
jgi:hypothetical protein